MALRTLELCSGVGMLGEGLRAGLGVLGIETRAVCHVEREAYAAAVLAARMEEGSLDAAPVWSDLLTFDAGAWRGAVDCVVAGFPCQDLSVAGKRAGLDGERSGLFFRVLDIADDCGAWCLFLENVGGIASAAASAVDEAEGALEERAAARVVGELADRGWDAEWITLSASDVGASHGRARWFCLAWRRVADAGHGARTDQPLAVAECRRAPHDCIGGEDVGHATGDGRREGRPELPGRQGRSDSGGAGGAMADAERARRAQAGRRPEIDPGREPEPRCGAAADPGQSGLPLAQQRELGGSRRRGEGRAVAELRGAPLFFAPGPADPRWLAILAQRPELAPALEPGFCKLVDGLAFDMDDSRAARLRCIGNGVVAAAAAAAVVELVCRARGMAGGSVT